MTEVDCIVVEGTDTAHVGQLRTVVDAAWNWVTQEIVNRTEEIRTDLQSRDFSELVVLPPPPGIQTPHTGSIGKRRRQGGSPDGSGSVQH